jgi:S1-C subfamily serine protease
MSVPDRFRLLAQRVRDTFGNVPLSQAFQDRKAIIGPGNFPDTDEGKLAQDALTAMENGDDPDPRGLAALQLMIKIMRPSLLIQEGKIEPLDEQASQTFPGWGSFTKSFEPIEFSIGRIDDASHEGVGTGFLVSPQQVVTNAHVVSFLSRGTMLLTKGQATINFRREFKSYVQDVYDVLAVVSVHQTYDLALLRIQEAAKDSRPPLTFGPDALPDSTVVAVGYPFEDRRNPLFISGIYKGVYGVKRAAPGKVVSTSQGAVTHDCSTLGGNSGSPLLDMKTAEIVGVHSEGVFMYTNQGISASTAKSFFDAYAN